MDGFISLFILLVVVVIPLTIAYYVIKLLRLSAKKKKSRN